MLDNLTQTDLFKGLISVVTGGAFVGWYREHRRGKKDAYTFAIEMIKETRAELAQERSRVDNLVKEIAAINAQHNTATEALSMLKQENLELKHENARLKTALAEQGRAA